MELTLTKSNWGRPRVGLPPTRLVNAYVESSPGGPASDIRTTRPGLTKQFDLGTDSNGSTIQAMYQQAGLFSGDLFTIVQNTLYRNSTQIGTLAYGIAPQMAAADGMLAIVSGGGLYTYDGKTLTAVTAFSDVDSPLPSFSSVVVIYSIFLYSVVGSDTFYFSYPGQPGNIQSLDFSAAQTAPDAIVQLAVLAEQLFIFGQTSVERWNYQGTLTAPFVLSEGQTFARGCIAQNSVRKLDNSLFWIGEDLTIYRTGSVPQRVSTSYIEDRLRACGPSISSTNCCTMNIEGHVFYVVNLVSLNESYALDIQTGEWSRWGTLLQGQHDPGVWIGGFSAGTGQKIYIGSYMDGRVFLLDTANHTDDGIPIQVVVSAAAYLPEGRVRNFNLVLDCVRGVGTSTTPHPAVQMRYSDDGGHEWSSWLTGDLGRQGGYRNKTVWRMLGIVQPPGRIFEFMITDPVTVAVEGVTANASRV